MLQQIIGKLTGGGGDLFSGPIPGFPALTGALDELERYVAEIGRDKGTGNFEEPVTAEERERLARLVDDVNIRLQEAGTLEGEQALALVGRATAVIGTAGHCDRYPDPVDEIGNLPIIAFHDSLAASIAAHGIDRTMHDALMMLAGTLTDALLEDVDAWAERIVALAKTYSEPQDGPADPARMLEAYILDASAHPHDTQSPKVQDLPSGKRILDADPELQRALLLEAFRVLADAIGENARAFKKQGGTSEWYVRSSQRRHVTGALVARLLMRKLPFEEQHLAGLYGTILDAGVRHVWDWPMAHLIGATEKYAKANGLGDGVLKAGLKKFLKKTAGRQLEHDHMERIERIIGKSENKLLIPHSTLGLAVIGWVNAQKEPVMRAWLDLLHLGLQTEGKAKPVAKWSGQAAEVVERIGEDAIVDRLIGWIDNPGIDLEGPEPNGDVVKGMIWAVAKGGSEKLIPMLSRLCETCYKKVPGVGPANVKLGNACIYALGEMPGERATAELVRLRSRIKFNQGRKKLDEALGAAAARAGLTVADLEEVALPTFGLDAEGSRKELLGEVAAEIRIAGSDEVTLSWTGADGKPRKTVPASVKADHADEFKALRAEIKEMKGLLAGQRFRLESLYLAQRSWSLADWRKRYLEHPLMANLARRLVWNFGEVAAVAAEGGFTDAVGAPVEPAGDAVVSLWHPLDADADGVLAWRRRLAALDIVQPFKQAHREIYVLTDAERATETYSNRFAAHILRQHQMNALCQARGWRYNLQGAWDQEESVPTLHLPNWRLSVEFWVDYASDDYLESGVYIYRATDQVRFLNVVGDPVPLERVPPLVLSEAMRDVDLFVGVASVGNDPEWLDRGPDAPFRQYWSDFSFGALGETAKTRKAVLEDLLPKLKIADKCEISGKFLKVRGTKRTYKIHLGSGNILMEPNDQYLCIVQGRGKAAGVRSDSLRLPFEGDGMFSVILSKAFLLAEDDKITDRTISSQIER